MAHVGSENAATTDLSISEVTVKIKLLNHFSFQLSKSS